MNYLTAWEVTLSGETPDSEIKIAFTDASEIFENTIGVNDIFIHKLLDLIKENENYSIYTGIKKVVSPSGEDKSDRALFILVGEDKHEVKFAILLGQVDEKTWIIVGFWPDAFAEACKEHNEILESILQSVLFNPDNWKFIEFVVPFSQFMQTQTKE